MEESTRATSPHGGHRRPDPHHRRHHARRHPGRAAPTTGWGRPSSAPRRNPARPDWATPTSPTTATAATTSITTTSGCGTTRRPTSSAAPPPSSPPPPRTSRRSIWTSCSTSSRSVSTAGRRAPAPRAHTSWW
ncbi:hypothetical protein NKG94_47910 [Micromonospora sp. M12]